MKKLLVITIILGIFMTLGAIQKDAKKEIKNPFKELSKQDQQDFLKLYYSDSPFSTSPDMKVKSTLYLFFTKPIYDKLAGNIFKGWKYDEGFQFHGNGISIERITGTKKADPYVVSLFNEIKKTLQAQEITFDGASSYKLGLSIVDVMPQKTKYTLPGITCEFFLCDTKTKKSFFYRFSTGAGRGVEASLKSAALVVVSSLLALSPERVRELEKKKND